MDAAEIKYDRRWKAAAAAVLTAVTVVDGEGNAEGSLSRHLCAIYEKNAKRGKKRSQRKRQEKDNMSGSTEDANGETTVEVEPVLG
jgi:hypothetical protein